MIKAVFFDLDGVLIYTELETFNFYKEVLGKRGIELPDEAFKFKAGRKSKDFFNDCFKAYGFSFDFQELVVLKREMFCKEFSRYVGMAENVKELMEKLKERGLKIAVTSQNEEEMVEVAVQNLGIRDLLDLSLSLKDIKEKKPSPEIYYLAAKNLGLLPTECLVVEDSFDGIMAAKQAGMKCLALVHEYMPEGSYSMADALIQDLMEIEQYIL